MATAAPNAPPDHPLMKELEEAIAKDSLDAVKEVVGRWQNPMGEPPPARGRAPRKYPVRTLEPAVYYAIRLDRPEIVDYLLRQRVRICDHMAWEAICNRCRPPMWQVFMKHRPFDVNKRLDDGLCLPPLGHVLDDLELMNWLLAHGASPNAESRHGYTPFLRAVQEKPLATVRLLHEAGASLDIAVPFVCQAKPAQPGESEAEGAARRMEVLRYLLDNGADPEAPMWAHNSRGYGNDFDFGTGLNRAIYRGYEDLAAELLRRGARTDSKTLNIASMGETALELAAKHGPGLVPLVAERRRAEELASGWAER